VGCWNLSDLSNNQFSGRIPNQLYDLSDLRYLFLAYNGFTSGTIPSLLGERLPSMINLSLRSTNRRGSLPESFDFMSTLQLLDLNDNAITGTLPSSLGNLPELEVLQVHNNQIRGTVPSSFNSLPNLNIVLLSRNFLNGNLTAAVCPNGVQRKFKFLSADCLATPQGGSSLITDCQCCTKCCREEVPCELRYDEPNLNVENGTFHTDRDSLWLYNYTKENYLFNGGSSIYQEASINST
jgi:Leucine rich repeat